MKSFENESFELIKFILTSDLRLKVVMALFEGNHNLDRLTSLLDKNVTNVSRTVKELVERGIIEKSGKDFGFTESGFLISMTITNLYYKWSLLEDNADFWDKHVVKNKDIRLLNHFQCLKTSRIIYSDNVNFNRTLDIYLDYLKKSKDLKVILPIFSNVYLNAFFNVIEKNNTTLELITCRNILEAIEESDFSKTFEEFVRQEKIKLRIIDGEVDIFLTVSDSFCSLFLFLEDSHFDESSMILSENEKCLKEINEFFKVYK